MDVKARAFLPDGDSSFSGKAGPSGRVGGGSDAVGSLSTLASGRDGSGMSPTAPLSGSSFDAVENSSSPGGNNASTSSNLDGPAASSDKPPEENLEASEETYSWRGGIEGLGFLLTAQVRPSSGLSLPSWPSASAFDNGKHC
jgi:hypothetical protein